MESQPYAHLASLFTNKALCETLEAASETEKFEASSSTAFYHRATLDQQPQSTTKSSSQYPPPLDSDSPYLLNDSRSVFMATQAFGYKLRQQFVFRRKGSIEATRPATELTMCRTRDNSTSIFEVEGKTISPPALRKNHAKYWGRDATRIIVGAKPKFRKASCAEMGGKRGSTDSKLGTWLVRRNSLTSPPHNGAVPRASTASSRFFGGGLSVTGSPILRHELGATVRMCQDIQTLTGGETLDNPRTAAPTPEAEKQRTKAQRTYQRLLLRIRTKCGALKVRRRDGPRRAPAEGEDFTKFCSHNRLARSVCVRPHGPTNKASCLVG